jgi:hypothetical protein
MELPAILSIHLTPAVRRTQADAIVLEGGYILFLIFRGDNTVPVFQKRFSPLHNRCLWLLSKMVLDGGEVYWDNLYPSRPVAAEIAAGGNYTGVVPEGPNAGDTISLTIPKTGTCGTARTNRGIAPSCRQPDKTGKNALTAKQIEELKEKPLNERVKSAMTKTEPRVVCVSVFDNGPVHLLSTIHKEGDKIITIERKRWDVATHTVKPMPIERLWLIDEYNHTMDFVDIADQLGHYYNLDGHVWRDRKWWMPIFKSLFKSSCDQGYVLYKRVCEIAEKQRVADEEARAAQAAAQGSPSDSPSRGTRTAHHRQKKITPISHFEFLEKIAEGFVIEAYNSTKKRADDHMSLYAYDLGRIERALAELRGEEPPSSAAQGVAGGAAAASAKATGMKGGKGVKRRIETEADGTLPMASLESEKKHVLIEKDDAVQQGYIVAKDKNFCKYKFCKWAEKNKPGKCGEKGAGHEQAGRARAPLFCTHPQCKCGYHGTCYSLAHGLLE